ncbi:uncharacterized protein A1O5_10056 [Cladophialophora psammophila CBS 110553]|uniref:Uncharacterized protein n=1 Tax=Cladophialophora psammophila CBS 110553 TaxID=1182543 RepID=W9WQF0_9EURO|nr:uncharacterized protein A1O5_10056 [Cladophialophora psammophila CBS 110553]EXJ66861.1 hypothetical protein A1O5_10056 [Cladophialophora psammophila CBS 110553]
MRTFHELPEHVLHDTISVVVDFTQSKGWQLSLRLVNRQFNEAVLHVYYLRQRLVASDGDHSLDCINPCHDQFCRRLVASQRKQIYAARFNFQSLLASRDLAADAIFAHQLLQQWKAALTMLRGVGSLEQLDLDQVRFYSTCSDNPIFNDVPSAILSKAVDSHLGPQFLSVLVQSKWNLYLTDRYQVEPPAFWVALSACVLGDLQLFEAYRSKLTLLDENSSAFSPPAQFIASQLFALLNVAIKHAKLGIVSRLLKQHPNLVSKVHTNYASLQAAIFSNNTEVLKALLAYTPNLPDLLTDASSRCSTVLTRSSSGTETIRLLTRHFSPLSAEARTWLIMHSCAVGDTALLEEFSKTESLFSNRIYDASGLIPTSVHFAIRCGNVDTLRFLLDHRVLENQNPQSLRMAMEQALSFNQIECYRELYQRVEISQSARYFEYLTWADNAEEVMTEFIRKYRSLIFEPLGDPDDLVPPLAQRALWKAIQRLRAGNVQFLLGAGVSVFPWTKYKDPFEVQWPYFNQNRDAFLRTQAVLDSFDLPKLRIIV